MLHVHDAVYPPGWQETFGHAPRVVIHIFKLYLKGKNT